MATDRRHRAFITFLRRVLEVPSAYSKEDLYLFRSLASRDYPSVVPVLEEYLRLAERADSDADPFDEASKSPSPKLGSSLKNMHLFDLLRDKRVFSSNAELSEFAARTLPDIRGNRFDKMSRGDIASRIIEFLETLDAPNRSRLEKTMRAALTASGEGKQDKRTFFSQWEKVIKGLEL